MTVCCSLYTSLHGSRSDQPRLATADLAVGARVRSLPFLAIPLPVYFRKISEFTRGDDSSVAIQLLFLEGNRGASGGTAGHRGLSSFRWYNGVSGEKQRVVASIDYSLLVNSSPPHPGRQRSISPEPRAKAVLEHHGTEPPTPFGHQAPVPSRTFGAHRTCTMAPAHQPPAKSVRGGRLGASRHGSRRVSARRSRRGMTGL